MRLNLVFLLGFVFLLSGCPTTESENVATPGIYAQYKVVDNGSRVEVSATFWAGNRPGGTIVELTGADEVTVNGRSLRREKNLAGNTYYKTNLARFDEYTFTFYRESGTDAEAFSANVAMPAKVQILSPKQGQTFRRGNAINLTWNGSGFADSEIDVTITGEGRSSDGQGTTSYVRGNSGIVDDGRYTLQGENTNPSSIRGRISNVQIDVTRTIRSDLRNFDELNGTIEASTTSRVGNMNIR